MREQTKLQKLCCAAVIGALYAAVTLLLAPISYGNLQCRVSEALCILPWFFPETAWGLFAGCLLANLLGGNGPLDIVFGSLATLIGAVGTRMMRKKYSMWAWIPPVLSNAIIVPFVLIHVYGVTDAWWFLFLTVGAGELISCGLIGLGVFQVASRVIPREIR